MRLSTLPLSALALGLMAAGTAAAAPYTITNLGTLGGKQSYAYAINDSGLVVGHSSGPKKANQTDPNVLEFNARAFLFDGSTLGQLGPVGHLGLIKYKDATGAIVEEVPNSFANAINENGLIVGYGVVDVDSDADATGIDTLVIRQKHPFVYANGQLANIGLPPGRGATEAIAEGINDANKVVGRTKVTITTGTNTDGTPKTAITDRAFVYDLLAGGGSPQWQILPVFDTDPNRGAYGLGINNNGIVMGSAGKLIDGLGYTRAYRWTPGDAQLTDLGGFSGKTSYPTGINGAGKIVGRAALTEYDPATLIPVYQGFLSEPGNSTLLNLGYLSSGKKSSSALGINDRDQVVGYSAIGTLISAGGASDLNHAFLSEVRSGSRVMLDLNNMLSCEDRKRWALIEARGINNRGQIVGVGTFDGEVRAFLLTPPTGESSGTVQVCAAPEQPGSGGGGGGSLAGGLLSLLAALGLARRALKR